YMGEALAEAGADLVITSRTLESVEKTAQTLREKYGREVLPKALDVTDYDQVAQLAEDARAWKNHVDVLINNAGGGLGLTPTNLFQRDPGHIRKLIDVNLVGMLFSCKAFGKIMVKQGSGKIINIASIAGLVGRDRRMYDTTGMGEQPIEYAAAKAGVIGATRDLAGLLSPKGVYVNAISPGGFKRSGMAPSFVDAYSNSTTLGHMGCDECDLKGAVLFLASSASDYVTGQNLAVDGGFTMWK
ncbi:MAG TPA: SDR family oxidoreductase, partial [Phycisphaerae bacterium]|nr:SDR family oxidoreductase [Phycisphaerae bacterium]